MSLLHCISAPLKLHPGSSASSAACLLVPISPTAKPCPHIWTSQPRENSALSSCSSMKERDEVHKECRAFHNHEELVSFSVCHPFSVLFLPYLSVTIHALLCDLLEGQLYFVSHPFLAWFGSAVPIPFLHPTKFVLSLFL